MNNDEQIKHIDSRLDTIERNQKEILAALFRKLEIRDIIYDKGGERTVLQIKAIHEANDGIWIEVI